MALKPFLCYASNYLIKRRLINIYFIIHYYLLYTLLHIITIILTDRNILFDLIFKFVFLL